MLSGLGRNRSMMLLFGRETEDQEQKGNLMKRYGNLFEKAFCADNLYQAYLDARQGKRTKRACFEFEKNLGANLSQIHKSLSDGSFVPDPYFSFIVLEPKRRVIHAPSFRDTVVQHAIYRVIYKLFDRSFIGQSFACRVGYGTHKAARYARRSMQRHEGDEYILKLDIRKFDRPHDFAGTYYSED
jgi:RNA-directed DNA polymerase